MTFWLLAFQSVSKNHCHSVEQSKIRIVNTFTLNHRKRTRKEWLNGVASCGLKGFTKTLYFVHVKLKTFRPTIKPSSVLKVSVVKRDLNKMKVR